MDIKRIILLVVCGACGLVVFVLLRNMGQAPDPVVVQDNAPAPVVVQTPMKHVLVAAIDLPYGHRVLPEDLRWQKWPEEAIGIGYVEQDLEPEALERFTSSVIRSGLIEGEPLTERKVVFPGDKGEMAALLEPGHRASAILISPEVAAGGFIKPNDRVDVLLTREQIQTGQGGYTGAQSFSTQTILQNVKVLAIDQLFGQGMDGQPAIIGSTATVELTKRDTEMLAQARAMGELSLALRSIRTDTSGAIDDSDSSLLSNGEEQTVVMIRNGRKSQTLVAGGQ